jgi:hypothetical protein
MRIAPSEGVATPALLLTPLVDVFAAVALFLAFGYAASPAAATRPFSDIVLPAGHGPALAQGGGVRLSVSHAALRLDNQYIMALQAGAVGEADTDAAGRVVPLYQALLREKLARLSGAQSQAERLRGDNESDALYVEASRGLPYGLIDGLLRTAAAAGFTRFRLAMSGRGVASEGRP